MSVNGHHHPEVSMKSICLFFLVMLTLSTSVFANQNAKSEYTEFMCQLSQRDSSCQSWRYSEPVYADTYAAARAICESRAARRNEYFCHVWNHHPGTPLPESYMCQLSTQDPSCRSYRHSLDTGLTDYDAAVRKCRDLARSSGEYFCKVY